MDRHFTYADKALIYSYHASIIIFILALNSHMLYKKFNILKGSFLLVHCKCNFVTNYNLELNNHTCMSFPHFHLFSLFNFFTSYATWTTWTGISNYSALFLTIEPAIGGNRLLLMPTSTWPCIMNCDQSMAHRLEA